MSLTFHGRVHRFGDEVNTDVILPGRYLTLRTPEELGRHCLEGLDPDFVNRVKPGDIIVAGRNFGCGSSREHAVIALKAAGVAALVVESAARIFFRNAVNLGLPVLVSTDAARGLAAGDDAHIDLDRMEIIQNGAVWTAQPLGDEVRAILEAGGLVPRVRQALGA